MKRSFIKKVLILFLIIFVIKSQFTAFARPGGGGGSSSSHSPSSSSHSTPSRYSSGKTNPIANMLNVGLFIFALSAGTIILKIKLRKKKIESVEVIKYLAKEDANWNYENAKKDIEETFYQIAIAWMERNQDIAKDYISEKLYTKHKMQTEWMKIRKEKNILKDMSLLKVTPIGLKDCDGIDNDILWVLIAANSIDYIINEETNEIIEGSTCKSVYYEEYWKFIKNKDRWVLDEILQLNDVDNLDFFNIDISKKI
ncbi:Tim44 domain-containing protein [Clostridium senegalense]|uniref:Tim44 domain-containing protein n=1 Tax=Clostridium senegalense TaxID=1465809 RepID=A0A6M0H5C4_9CLOT|nr:Tim44-like domain-containing protein [Clostridium senegalense]NEU05707.1 Tim44 domain-containing protein [Clostridium senegalense]